MKERPILFSGPMVRAILDGAKKQTRRVVKPQPHGLDYAVEPPRPFGEALQTIRCPYGIPGDRLWVRENLTAKDGYMVYAADGGRIDCGEMDWPACIEKRKTIPSIHMPRWVSRILLEITSVRVERLNDISKEDAIAEGIRQQPTTGWFSVPGVEGAGTTARAAYAMLWESINGPGSWETNPWVWVIEFKRVTQ